jgi:acyl carrier protein
MSIDEFTYHVANSIAHINQQLPSDKQISSDLSTKITGPGSDLDSLSLINLVIDIEEKIATSMGRRISILDKGIMSEENKSINTLGELIDWIAKQS